MRIQVGRWLFVLVLRREDPQPSPGLPDLSRRLSKTEPDLR